MAWVTFMSGHPVMAEKMMIVIAMVMPHQCGPFPSIQPSILAKMHTTMKVALPLWPPLFQMEPKIQTPE